MVGSPRFLEGPGQCRVGEAGRRRAAGRATSPGVGALVRPLRGSAPSPWECARLRLFAPQRVGMGAEGTRLSCERLAWRGRRASGLLRVFPPVTTPNPDPASAPPAKERLCSTFKYKDQLLKEISFITHSKKSPFSLNLYLQEPLRGNQYLNSACLSLYSPLVCIPKLLFLAFFASVLENNS